MNRVRFLLAAAATAAALATTPAAAGVPVIDPSNIAQTAKVVQNGLQQVQQLKQQVSQLQNMTKTLGSGGIMSIAKTALSQAGVNYSDLTNSPLSQYRSSMPGLLDALPGSNLAGTLGMSNLASLAQSAKSNIGDGRELALGIFYKSGNATSDEIEARSGVRAAAMRDSVTNGYAMAVYTKTRLGQNDEPQMKALSDTVSNAQDLRSDVQANSAIALSQLQQITVQNQLLAQLLEVQSTTAMATTSAGSSAPTGVGATQTAAAQ